MKKKLLAMTLIVAFILTGCGAGKPNAELGKFADEIIPNQGSTVPGPEATTAPTTAPTDAVTEEDSSTESEADSTAEDKYYLTFEATTTDGTAWNSDRFADSKLTMINVWGTYCNPCLSEMPDLGELAAEYDSVLFQIVGVVCDVTEDDSAKNIDYAKQLITETKANYPHLLANESVYMSFLGAVSAVPTTFFVRRDGSLVGYLTGAMEKENWKALIDDLLSKEQ